MGTVVLSIDAELGWGFHDVDHPVERTEAARLGWHRLIELFNSYQIPATWAVVGHLFLDRCDGHHDDHPGGEEWFSSETGKWANRPDLRFGPDLIHQLKQTRVDHEIGSHTFSHVIFGDENTTREVARAELEYSNRLARQFGIHNRSFVFPRNSVGFRDLLAEYGFITYRGSNPQKLSSLGKLMTATLTKSESWLVDPRIDEFGLVDIPASLFLFEFEGLPKRTLTVFFEDPVVNFAKQGIDTATHAEGVFHMWLHPNNLVGPTEVDRVEAILSYLDNHRRELEIATMADVATQCLSSSLHLKSRSLRCH